MKATIVDSGLDYLTATTTPKMPVHTDFDATAQEWFAEKVLEGFNVKEARSKGYDGLRLDGVFYGKREDSCIWETSGAAANEVASVLRERGIMPRITRADFQVTFESGKVPQDWAYQKLDEASALAKILRRSPKQTIGAFKSAGYDTGFTLGRRGSQAYFRAYLAGAKHKDKYSPDAVRDEAEFRGQRAVDLFSMHQMASNTVDFTMGVVRNHMEKKLLWSDWHLEADIVEFPALSYHASEERSVLWIENHVCPVIERLGNGPFRNRIIAALTRALKYNPQESQRPPRLEA